MIKNGFLCLPVVDESEEPIFIPEGFKLSEVESDRTSYMAFKRSSEGVWEELIMYFYPKVCSDPPSIKVVVYRIEYYKETALDFSHSIHTQEFLTFSQLRDFFKVELAKAG